MADALVACFLIAIGVAGLHTVAVTAITGNLLATQNDQAASLAAQKIEQLKRAGYAAVPLGTTTDTAKNLSANQRGLFTCTTTVIAGTVANTKQVRVEVTWPNRTPRTVTLTAVMTSAG